MVEVHLVGCPLTPAVCMHIWKILPRRKLCWGIDDADAFAEVEREASGNKWSLPVASGADPLSRRIVRLYEMPPTNREAQVTNGRKASWMTSWPPSGKMLEAFILSTVTVLVDGGN